MATEVIPNAVILPPDVSGQSPPSRTNTAVRKATKMQLISASRDSIIPVLYGGPERMAGMLYTARIRSGKLVLCLLLCEGGTTGVEAIDAVELNDVVLTGGSWVADSRTFTGGVIVKRYFGTAGQAVDPTMAAAITGYTETHPGTAYLVVQIPPSVSGGFPRITVEVKGLKLYDPRGKALQFGATSYVSGGNLSGLVATDGPATIEGWYSFSQFAVARVANNVLHSQLYQHSANNYFYLGGAGADYFAVGATLSLDVWYHIALTYTGFHEFSILYINGVAYPVTIQSPNSSHAALNPMTISAVAGLMGTVDELRVWNVVRTPAQILDYMNKRAIGTESGLVASWRMDESAGSTTADATTNAFTGTLVNTPVRVVGQVLQPASSGLQGVWSDNPALCLADFLTNTTYGAGKPTDAGFFNSVDVTANYCDELCVTEKRALLTIALAESREVDDWIEVLRAYVPGWVDYVGPYPRIIADKPQAFADHVFTAASINMDPLPTIVKRGVRNRPNVVEIGYMKTDVKPWVMDYAVADTSPIARRKARISMPGIRRFSQAKRFAVERLNHYNLESIETQIPVFEDGLKVMLGDLCDITDDIGFTATRMRVLGRQDQGHGRWLLGLRKYDGAAYDSTVQTTPTTPDTGLPDPRVVEPITSLVLVEAVYLEKDLPSDSVSRGFVFQSRIAASWVDSVHVYPTRYRVRLKDGTTVINETVVLGTTYNSAAVQQGRTYTVEVTAENSLGFQSAAVSDSLEALGKLLLPGNVPAIITAFELGGTVILEWEPAIDIDIDRYEWKYALAAGFSYDAATLIDRVDGLRAAFRGLPVGTWRFAVKAMDSVGNRSVSETTVDVTVTSDNDAFLQSREFTSPTLVNMMSVPMIENVWKPRWATSVAGQTFNDAITGTVNSVATPIIQQHLSGTQSATFESWDLGVSVTADFTLAATVVLINGAYTSGLETSPDGTTWTRRVGNSWKGAARFVRIFIEALTSSTIRIDGAPKISIAAQTRTESAEALTLLTGGKLVQLTGLYAAVSDLQVTPINTSQSRTAVVDRILLYPETGLLHSYTYNGSGDNYTFRHISNLARLLVAGDYIEFDVWIDSSTPAAVGYSNGGLYFNFTDATNSSALVDVEGYTLYAPAIAFDVLARGVWKSRKADLAAYVGKTTSLIHLVQHSNAVSGVAKTIYRNIRFTDGAGTDRAGGSVWASGEPVYNVDGLNALVTNIQAGPANSFNLYAFTSSSGAQVASDVRWTFKGF